MASSGAVPTPDPTAPLVGQSPAMHALRTQIRHLATFDTLPLRARDQPLRSPAAPSPGSAVWA
jgi:hypothetical protein